MVERSGVLKLIIEDDEGRKTVVPFVRDEITIGRQEGNTIRLTERNVSRRHARLMRNSGQVLIEDLGSYNGIRINGDRISGQVQVADGDLIQIGDYDLALQAEEAVGATVPLSSAMGDVGATRKLNTDHAATMPALPAVEAQEAADEDIREAVDDGEVGRDTPQAIPKHQSTAVIRIDQIEGSGRKRPLEEIDISVAPRLVVLNTEFAGREFPCTRSELKIGRTDDNDVALDHRSLSRTHCKIVREATGEWRVIDMQSANGLMVNGEPYAQVTLRPGDVIELGHVKLKFVSAGEQVDILPSASSSTTADVDEAVKSKTPLVAIAVAVLVVLLGGGGYAAWKGKQPVAPPKVPTTPMANTPKPPVKTDEPKVVDADAQKVAAAAKLEQARAAAQLLDWSKAELAAKEAVVGDGLIPEATAFLALLDSEKVNRTAIENATRALADGELEKARTQLDSSKSTKLLKARWEELDSRRQTLVNEKLAAAKNPVKTEPKPKPPPDTVAEVRPSVPVSADPRAADGEAMSKQASDDKKAGHLEAAVLKLEKCVKIAPGYLPCYRQLGSAYASIGSRDSSAAEMDKAKKYYEKYLELAPEDDPYVAKIRTILRPPPPAP